MLTSGCRLKHSNRRYPLRYIYVPTRLYRALPARFANIAHYPREDRIQHCTARIFRIRARLSVIRLSNGLGLGPLYTPLPTVRRAQPLSPNRGKVNASCLCGRRGLIDRADRHVGRYRVVFLADGGGVRKELILSRGV